MLSGNQVGDELADTGDVLLSAQRTVHLMDAGPLNSALNGTVGPGGAPILTPGSDGVVDLSFTIPPAGAVITKADAFHIVIDWTIESSDPAVPTGSSVNGFDLVADAEHRSRLEFSMEYPLAFDYLHPQVASGMLLVHASVSSPWGPADLDFATERAWVTGPVDYELGPCFSGKATHIGSVHDRTLERTCVLEFRNLGAPDGDYVVHYEIMDVAHQYRTWATGAFHLDGNDAYGEDEKGQLVSAVATEETQASPPAAAATLLAALGMLAASRRGRGS